MHFQEAVCSLCLSTLISLVTAGPGGFVTLINASPYDWKLIYSHSYQMEWQPAKLIPAGTSHEQYLEYWYNHGDNGDDAAEATYELVGSHVPSSFQLQARQSRGKHLRIEYLDGLSSLNNPKDSIIDLGFEHDGGVSFILSGDGVEPYLSTNPPTAWMQATVSKIGSKTLREVVMPASHNSGMSDITGWYGGVPHNSRTQSGNLYDQLVEGARWFDIRPVHLKAGWYTGHFSEVPRGIPFIKAVGATGRDIRHIVDDINSFTAKSPGELIILDLTHEMDGSGMSWAWELSHEQWQYLYEVLADIKDLWATSGNAPDDYTSVPISTFIQPGSKSAVLIRIPGYAPLPRKDMPSKYRDGFPHSAIVQDFHLPLVGSYSNTDNQDELANDQISKLQRMRVMSQSVMQRSTWTITAGFWVSIDVVNEGSSIIGQARRAHRMLFSNLWPWLTKDTYPNLIEVDDIHNSQVAALAMAINNNYAKDAPKVEGKQRRPRQQSTVTVAPIATPLIMNLSTLAGVPTLTPTPATIRIKGRAVEMPK
jgi:hypothetical protein